MATPIQPNASVPVTDAQGRPQRDWINYWADNANQTATVSATVDALSATVDALADATGALFFPTRTAAAAATIPTDVTLVRVGGRTAIGDGGTAHYQYVASEPTSPAKFQSANGRWFAIVIDQPYYTPGLIGDNSAANDTVMTGALAGQLYSANKIIRFGPGIYYFADNISVTVSDNQAISFVGCGPGVTEVRFASGKGFVITQVNSTITQLKAPFVNFNELSIATDGAGTGTGVKIITSLVGYPTSGTSSFTNVHFHGHGYLGTPLAFVYWGTAVEIRGIQNVNFYGCTFFSAINNGDWTSLGRGVYIHADVGHNSTIYNFLHCNFASVGTGIEYGYGIQGVSVTGCNFTGGNYGIRVTAGIGASNIGQLSVANSQFSVKNTGIWCETVVPWTQIANCLFIPYLNGRGIILGALGSTPNINDSAIIGCTFYGANQATTYGIIIDDSTHVNIHANFFFDLAFGIAILNNAANIILGPNQYSSNGVDVQNNSPNVSTIWRSLFCRIDNTTAFPAI